uniref:Uncharacterized protein n=1 Tax=Lotus japonicus TaxID=34305 RepID=I3T8P5_LOTJA|nr:unknown [Lotus japonicus]
MDSSSKCWSCGGLERPRLVQVEQCHKISSTSCQKPFEIIASGKEAFLLILLFCYGFQQIIKGRRSKKVRGILENSHVLELLGSQQLTRARVTRAITKDCVSD